MLAVSVLVNTYNQEKTIRRCLDAILCQQFDLPYEIVLTDDASCDATAEICKSYQEKYPSIIKLHINPVNKGIVDSYYDALLRCEGKYIADCAGDDYWVDPLKLRKEYEILESDSEITLVHSSWKSIDKESGIISSPRNSIHDGPLYRDIQSGQNLLLPILTRQQGIIIHLCTAMYRRDIFLEEYYKDPPLFRSPEYLCEDLQLITVMAMRGKIAHIPDVTLHYQTGGISDTDTNRFEDVFKQYYSALKLTRKLQLKYGIADNAMQSYYNTIIPFLAAQLFYWGPNKSIEPFKSYVKQLTFRKSLKYLCYSITLRITPLHRLLLSIISLIKSK